LLHALNMRPRRTVRAVLFVDEEVRQSGARAYAAQHETEAVNIVAAIETDMGVGPVCGFGFSGSSTARKQLRQLLAPLQAVLGQETHGQHITEVNDAWNGMGVDITPMIKDLGVPGLLLRHEDVWWNNQYFHLHHTVSDTIDHVDVDKLLLNFQIMLGTVWILANCDEKLAR
jgi:carboxypeptidase Q